VSGPARTERSGLLAAESLQEGVPLVGVVEGEPVMLVRRHDDCTVRYHEAGAMATACSSTGSGRAALRKTRSRSTPG
jgi:hypothetical protein